MTKLNACLAIVAALSLVLLLTALSAAATRSDLQAEIDSALQDLDRAKAQICEQVDRRRQSAQLMDLPDINITATQGGCT